MVDSDLNENQAARGMTIHERLDEIRARIRAAAKRCGRLEEDVRLVAVSKTRTVEEIQTLVDAGVVDFGENRMQEVDAKYGQFEPGQVCWHLIGHLQKNKAKRAVERCDWIHSVDTLALAQRIDRLASEEHKIQKVLVQVDLAGEATKSGLPESELSEVLEAIDDCGHVKVEGLMLLPPYLPEPNAVRPYFARLRELAEQARSERLLPSPYQLSMGMSHDFDVAIEEGATMVRVGTALFGPRPALAREPDAAAH